MQRIKETDNRDTAIKKFDRCMERFFSSSKTFLEEMKRITQCDENNLKIYSLALNYYHDTNLVVDISTSYYEYIAYSMLSVDYPKHDNLYKRFSSEFLELKDVVKKIVESCSIGLDNSFSEESAIILVDEQLAALDKNICSQFEDKGSLYFAGIQRNLNLIDNRLNSLQCVGEGRSASSYEEIYNRMKEEFYNSDLWENLKNKYISNLINRTFRNKSITIKAIDDIINDWYGELGGHEEIGNIWEAYEDNKTELSKAIIKKEFKTASPIEHMFTILGKIELLLNWKEEIRFEELPYEEAEEETGLVQGVKFVNEREEQSFKDAWPKIYIYMEEVKDADYAWCCLHHTMTFYHYIERTSFKYFMKWLNGFSKKELISEVNIRQVSFHYFIDVVETRWSLEAMEDFYKKGGKQKITPQLRKKYVKYSGICYQLREILLAH